jgi:hypothetical protein
MPFIVAIHDVSDPARFWGSAAEGVGNLPQGVTLHSTYPQGDGAKAVCLWEADSVETVRQTIESGAGDSSRNQFFEADPGHEGARGFPAQATSAS